MNEARGRTRRLGMLELENCGSKGAFHKFNKRPGDFLGRYFFRETLPAGFFKYQNS